MRSEYIGEDEDTPVSDDIIKELVERNDREGMKQYLQQCVLQRLPAAVHCTEELIETVFLAMCPLLNRCYKGVGMILCDDSFIPAVTSILQYLFPHFHLHLSSPTSFRSRDLLVLSPSSLTDFTQHVELTVLMSVNVTTSLSRFITAKTQVLMIQTTETSSLQSCPYHFIESYPRSKDTSVSITTHVVHLSPIQEQIRNDLLDRFTTKPHPSQTDLLHSVYLLTRQIDRMTLSPSLPCTLPPLQFSFHIIL